MILEIFKYTFNASSTYLSLFRIEKGQPNSSDMKRSSNSGILNEEVAQAKTDVDEFIRRLKLYFNSPTLTREMCLALFDKLIIGGKETVTGKPQATRYSPRNSRRTPPNEHYVHLAYRKVMRNTIRQSFPKRCAGA